MSAGAIALRIAEVASVAFTFGIILCGALA
jgi:hypothetical protein